MKFRWHSQNLTADRGPRRPLFWRGRAWFYFGLRREVAIEWSLVHYARSLHAYLSLGGGDSNDEVMFALSIPYLISVYLTFTHFLPAHWFPRRKSRIYGSLPCEREIGFRIFDNALWVSLWEDPMMSDRDDPWWWKFTIHPIDVLFGRQHYSDRDLYTGRVDVLMPEGLYPASVRMFESTWKRPRWPWPTRMVRADIVPERPIPHPGKGENSWDCGEDATYSMTCPARTPAEAAQMLRESVLHSRAKYGGHGWLPSGVTVSVPGF